MSELVQYQVLRGVAVVTIENPPVNALSPGVPEGIAAAVSRAASEDAVRAIVVMGGGRTFIAGADIKEFGKITAGQKPKLNLHPILNRIEDSAKPVVMAIHGTALGGGLEVAMAGHYRVAVASAQVGQPEVKLGIIPGAAGTQRLPRLAGVEMALEMCSLGEPVSASKAFAAGILDRIVPGDLLTGAIEFALEAAALPVTRVRDRDGKLQATPALFQAARETARKRMRGQTAPLAAIDAVAASTELSFDEGCAREAELFNKCLFADQSKALIHVFFGERTVTKIPDIPRDTPMLPVARAAIVGAGTMGGGIAMNYLNAGIPVLLKETDQESLDRGLATIRKNYANTVKKGKLTQEEMDRRMSLLTPTLSYDGFGEADIAVEAVFENMELKKRVFADLDGATRPECILASNTSTLNIDEIAAATSRPEMVIGHHFFSPANVMRLLEIVRGAKTAKPVIATSMELARRLKKVGVLVGNCRGFVGNRMFHEYMREAVFLAEEGARVEFVDRVLYDFGMAMGPLAVGDLAGLDVGWRIRQEFKHLEMPGVRYPKFPERLYEMGRHGQKTSAGWYRYDENRVAFPDPEVEKAVREMASVEGIAQREIDAREVIERTVFALVNEGARILEEGIALRPVDIDIIYVNGYGFPAWRGGPMKYADLLGLKQVYERVVEFHRRFGYHWKPAPLLERLAKEGKSFDALSRD